MFGLKCCFYKRDYIILLLIFYIVRYNTNYRVQSRSLEILSHVCKKKKIRNRKCQIMFSAMCYVIGRLEYIRKEPLYNSCSIILYEIRVLNYSCRQDDVCNNLTVVRTEQRNNIYNYTLNVIIL